MPTHEHTRSRTAAVLALTLSGAVLTVALIKGAFIAGGADSFGYVSQAELWARAELRVKQPFAWTVPWPSADWTWSPNGYRPAPDRNGDSVPVYAPGLPMVLAVLERIGGERAASLAVPSFGALTIWLTFVLGRRLTGDLTGLMAAALMGSSPTFLYMVMSPMSDVPVTAWWLLAVIFATTPSRVAALAGGLAASLAVLTRPNLVFLGGVIGVYVAWIAVRERSATGPGAQRLLLFAAPLVITGLGIALLFDYWYGSPFTSGYGSLDRLFAWSFARTNIEQYSRWFVETQTPFACLALAAPVVVRRWGHAGLPNGEPADGLLWLYFATAGGVALSYLFYTPFDAWWYLRYLLPAFPLAFVLGAAVVHVALAGRRPLVRRGAALLLTLALAGWCVMVAAERDTFQVGANERKYPRMARYITARLPERAVFLALQHGGSVQYYAHRLTLRYTYLDPDWLDRALAWLQEQGQPPYILLEDWEAPLFRQRFAGSSPIGQLDWPPMAELRTGGGTRVWLYAPGDRARYLRGESIVTERIQ